MTLVEIRKLFPHLSEEKIYFNHASTGPMSVKVKDILLKLIEYRTGDKIDDYQEFLKISEEIKKNIAIMINAKPSEIAFIDNTSNGMNILAQGMRLNKGDRILLNDIEFPANVYPFLNLQKNGIEVDFVNSRNGIVSAEDIIESVKPNTKIISVSQVQFLTGYRIDLKKVGNFCKENKIIFSIDAIQGLGAVNLDVRKDNIGFISCGTQKWLLGLQGFGFIYVSEELLQKLESSYAGWLSVKNAWNLLDYDLNLKNSADRFQTGTVNIFGAFALNESLNILNSFGFDNIEKRIVENSGYFLNQFINAGYEPVLKDVKENEIAGIVSIIHKNSNEIFNELKQKNVTCAVREGIIRFSPHFYNTKEEIDQVISTLKEIEIINN